MMKRASWLALAVVITQGAVSVAHADGWGETNASNLVEDGIAGTRHNLTMSYLGRDMTEMDFRRNNYREVCVYCHTPHGANNSTGIGIPLWNRTIDPSINYEPYNIPTTLQLGGEQTITDPGPASLTCLSCHDGVTAIDSIINMPGSGMYQESQERAVDTSFLRTWNQAITADSSSLWGCADACHNYSGSPGDFKNFVIGAVFDSEATDIRFKFSMDPSVVDLRDDHPVGVLYPTALTNQTWVDFRPMDVEIPGRYAFFDDGNGRADKDEIRVYDSSGGAGAFEVECASCHDPHGVPEVAGVNFIPSFLRVSNADSTLCLTCHIK